MSNRHARVLAAGGAAVLAVTLGAPAALAAGTWTIQPGGGIRAASGVFIVNDTTTGTAQKCSSSTTNGDPATLSAAYAVTPKQTITSP